MLDYPLAQQQQGTYSSKKTDKILKDLPNKVGAADDILIAGYDESCHAHDTML